MLVRKEWNRLRAKKEYEKFLDNQCIIVDCDKDYLSVREDLLNIFQDVSNKTKASKLRQSYLTDIFFGIELYKYFVPGKNGFTMEIAEDSNFWSYLSIRVIPDIVNLRWQLQVGNEGRFYCSKTRIWLGQIWWFIHFTFYESIDKTEAQLLSDGFSTDTIMQLVDRTGSKGVFVDVYREIINQYALYDKNQLINTSISYDQLFKNVMKLNTAKIILFEPPLYKGGVKGYVSDLFKEATIRK